MTLPEFPAFTSSPTSDGRGRFYLIDARTQLAAFLVEAALPHAPEGFVVYAFVQGGRVGAWDWTADPASLEPILQAFRDTTSPEYSAPDHHAPGGELAHIRPPIRDLLARLMEQARPGPIHAVPATEQARAGLTLIPPLS